MPFDRTTVIPAGWSAHHQGTAAGGMNATVAIGNTAIPGEYDPATDDTTTTWSDDYDGPARVQPINLSEQRDVAGQQVSGRGYLVQISADAARITPGARVHVTEAVNDAHLVGEDLWVVDVQMGSERFTRDLVCSDSQADTPTEAP